MKTKEEMIERYHILRDEALYSRDEKKMKILGDAESWAFKEMAASAPEKAESWLSHLEAIRWNNFLSEKEAMNIGKRMKNADGTTGYHWNHDVFTKAVQALGGTVEEYPCYNSYALCVVANMVYSDHALSIAEDMGFKTVAEVPNERMALSCYKKAVEKLKDKDGNFHVRKYFKHRMYDDSPI